MPEALKGITQELRTAKEKFSKQRALNFQLLQRVVHAAEEALP